MKFKPGEKMFKPLLVSAALLLSLPAFAEDGHSHTPNVCSTKNPDVCAHLGIYGTLKSSVANRFIVDILTPGNAAYSNLKVVLWMPDMGHGSSPVSLQDIGSNHYMVTDAWFIMKGKWAVKLNFDFNGQNLDIEIPVEITE
jgi:YtkA-like protein